ncbi:MAG TPA: OprD family outer membrane porin, partial [Pseudomonas sp.]|nr:OprD family outer membrane porin [Pseudomonas sp.]
MSRTPLARAVALATLGTCLTLPLLAQAEFIKDSKASVEARNFYFNRDFRQTGGSIASGQAKQEEWAQGFILRLDSGYSEGTVGFGADAIGMFGFKLDSGDGTAGSGLLVPDRSSGGSQDNYSGLAVAAKAKISKSTLRVGGMQFKNQAIASSDARLLPQIFQAGHLLSQEIDGLTLDMGHVREMNERNSNDYQDIALTTGGRRGITTSGGTTSDSFSFLGGNYKITPDLTVGYYHSKL